MNKPKLNFIWTDEAALRERFQGLLRAHDTSSCRDLGAGHGSKSILISARYAQWLARTARDNPESARIEDLSRSYSHMQAIVGRWLAQWRPVDWSDVLLIEVQCMDWIVDDGIEMQVATAFVASAGVVAVCLVDELEARGETFEIDRILLETERRHLGDAANGTEGSLR